MATKKINHASRKHALLSASGASRWMGCTPSARLEEKFPDKTSEYAEEGTLAHEMADLELRHKLARISDKVYASELKKLKKHRLYGADMDGEVEKYVTIVLEAYQEALARTPDAVLLLEQRLDFSHLVEKGFGTGDVVIIADGVVEVIDLKYGRGVQVDAPNNPQLMLYGSGALREYELLYDIQSIKLTIVQPRKNHLSSWEISAEDLESWGEEQVRPKAEAAYLGDGEQTPGDWCKFCKAKHVCRALAEQNMALAKYDFRDPQVLSDEELLAIFKQLPVFSDWANSISSYILDEALKGKQWKGYKIVEGRSVRKWLDDEKVIDKLKEEGFEADKFMVAKLAGIGAVEKLVGKGKFPAMMQDLIIKPQGAPTLVEESDKRPAMGLAQAKEDFKK